MKENESSSSLNFQNFDLFSYTPDPVVEENIELFLRTPIDSRSTDLSIDLRKKSTKSTYYSLNRPSTSIPTKFQWKDEIPFIVRPNQKRKNTPRTTIPDIAKREIEIENKKRSKDQTTIESLSEKRKLHNFSFPSPKDYCPSVRKVPKEMARIGRHNVHHFHYF